MKNFFIAFFIFLLLNSFIYIVNANEIKFSDVPNNHWAKTSIEHLNSRGTLSGYEDGTFKPDNMITRAEAAKILMTTFKSGNVPPYPTRKVANDVPESHWANVYIVYGQSYILPDNNGNFRPDETITRGDFAFALYEMLKYSLPSMTSNTKYFSDVSSNNSNYSAIYALFNNGLINGFEDNTFRPNDGLTRAQVCKLVDDAYNYLMNNYTTEMKNTSGWATYKMGDNLFKEVYADKEGNLMVYTGRETDLYYNGEFVVSIDSSIKTVKEETITTSNNEKWKIKWFGNDVVEMTREGTQRIIKDNYSGISKTYDKEYIPYEELLKDLKYFTGLNYEIKNEYGAVFLKTDEYGGVGISNPKTIDGETCYSISYIRESIWNLYINTKWNGPDLQTLKNNRKNNKTGNETSNKNPSEVKLNIPDIPVESFASQAEPDNKTIAHFEDVISINKNTYESISETKTRPVYYMLKELYTGKEAEQIIENYNKSKKNSSELNYTREIQGGNLYCILLDIDLKDFYYKKEGNSFTIESFIEIPKITGLGVNNNTFEIVGTTTIISNEPKKSFYHTGDLTQVFIIVETPKNMEATALHISFMNDDDDSYKEFFVYYDKIN